MDFLDVYEKYIDQTPSDHYHDFNQAVMDYYWDDTTQIRNIEEQNFPFEDEYIEYEALINTVSDITTNTTKVIGDYISIMFKDIDHDLNHRGQKYLYAPDGDSEQVYLCYNKMESLAQVPSFKAIRCNNHLSIMLDDGSIVNEPCVIGEMTSTNNQITKKTTLPQRRFVCLVQGNDYTKDIKQNQRFILQNNGAFKVTEINKYNQEDYNTENVTMYTMYIEWSALDENLDNLELNIADYYLSDYKISINSGDLSITNSSTGILTATVILNDEITSGTTLKWETSDSDVISIDSEGNYQVIGESGSIGLITCSIDGNEDIKDTINVEVVDVPSGEKELIINPINPSRLLLKETLDISYGVYIGEELQTDVISISTSGAEESNYSITYETNKMTILNIKKSLTPLLITFTSNELQETVSLDLSGII